MKKLKLKGLRNESIKKRLFEWDSHHSNINEEELVDMLQELEDKINEIVKLLNNKG